MNNITLGAMFQHDALAAMRLARESASNPWIKPGDSLVGKVGMVIADFTPDDDSDAGDWRVYASDGRQALMILKAHTPGVHAFPSMGG